MPFEIAPQVEAPAKVGEFQKYADALLAGCAVTRQIYGEAFDGHGGACAMGALFVGLGWSAPDGVIKALGAPGIGAMYSAYIKRYGNTPWEDNDFHKLTRERIAARIAAL